MRDIIKILENIENKLTEKAFPSEEEVENKIVDMVDFLGINGMFGDEDEGYMRATFYTDDMPKDELIAELEKRFGSEGYEIVDMEEGATEVIFLYD